MGTCGKGTEDEIRTLGGVKIAERHGWRMPGDGRLNEEPIFDAVIYSRP